MYIILPGRYVIILPDMYIILPETNFFPHYFSHLMSCMGAVDRVVDRTLLPAS